MRIELLNDGSEQVHYDEPGTPVYIRTGNILSFPEGKVIAHRHKLYSGRQDGIRG